MKHKSVARIAIIMLVVFGATVLLYPTLFSPEPSGNTPVEAPPIVTPGATGK